MRHSWTLFGVGVGVGLVAIALLFIATSYFYISALLLLISNYLTVQPTKAPDDDQDATVSSDLDEWRQFGRQLINGFRGAIVPLFGMLSIMFLWDIAVRRYPFLADVPKEHGELLAVMLLTAMWLMQVVVAFHSGRTRRLSSSS